MPLIQIEQDNSQLMASVRAKIALAAEVIRRSYQQDEWRALQDRTWEVAHFAGYLAGLHEHGLLSQSVYVALSLEWENARRAAGVDPMARALLSEG